MRRPTPRDPRGFTLVEVLVALVIAGVVISAAFAMLRFAGDVWSRVRGERATTIGGAAARSTLEEWLRAAAPVEGAGVLVAVQRDGDAYPRDEVAFGAAHAGPLYPGPHRIHLWVDTDPETPRRGLLAELTPVRGRVEAPPDTLAVVPEALGMSLRYAAQEKGGWEWRSSWEGEGALPVAVELTLFAPPLDPRHGGLPRLLRPPLLVSLNPGGG